MVDGCLKNDNCPESSIVISFIFTYLPLEENPGTESENKHEALFSS